MGCSAYGTSEIRSRQTPIVPYRLLLRSAPAARVPIGEHRRGQVDAGGSVEQHRRIGRGDGENGGELEQRAEYSSNVPPLGREKAHGDWESRRQTVKSTGARAVPHEPPTR
jgi:hypothetical protein